MTDDEIFKLLTEACGDRVRRFSDFERLGDQEVVHQWMFVIAGQHTVTDHQLFLHKKVRRVVSARAYELHNYGFRETVQQMRERYRRCGYEPLVAVYRCTIGTVANPYRAEHYLPGTPMHLKLTQHA